MILNGNYENEVKEKKEININLEIATEKLDNIKVNMNQ